MTVQVVFVHGIRTSSTMWRAQALHLRQRGNGVIAVDLPGHGTRRGEPFTLEEAFATIDRAVRDAAARGPVVLVGHSMGGLLSMEYVGRDAPPPVAALVAASCTSLPRGPGLATYRFLIRRADGLPDRGLGFTNRVLDLTLPPETRPDFGAGGYAFEAQDSALASLTNLDLMASLRRIDVPLWFVNGQWDQLRLNEKLFTALAPHAELIVVPRTTHIVTAMRPRVFNAVLDVALTTVEASS
ncbi:pimeloyl-ACP methyl ester carboxylesterase [Microbacterium proteolyticum]|uniref:Pimeloyl-ACP methyl ester carboxylesterase n=1 Tax=Microbacterium proteolyticum TaxID=1572644 RepID=A0A7W5CIK4_9MICO|nr:alpha/beta hydrolase [Microbacterium proteolyticum]MBB3158373.1 pimeloyl-ACP methyl ester carboxylesterase [Microbacterium proteolyticum]